MGNTLGALTFLAAATWLGWTIVRGRAQSFLSAVSSGTGGGGGSGTQAAAGTGGSTPPPITGPLQGSAFNVDPYGALETPVPNVFNGAFGQNSSVNAPGYNGAYGVYSPTLKIGGN